jgi:hypothetical protein
MDYEKYILIDYDNVHNIKIDNINEKTKVLIIIGKKNKIQLNLIKKLQPYGESVEWIEIENDEKINEFCFNIIYFFGNYILNHENKEFLIYSNNKNYDSFIEYLKTKNINVNRITTKRNILTMIKKLPVINKICLIVLLFAIIGSFIVINKTSLLSSMIPVINMPIQDEVVREKVLSRIDREGVKVSVSPNGLIYVSNEETARRIRAILIREDLIPYGIDPWAIFDRDRWTITDFERNINFQRAQTRMITEHIKAIDGIDNVIVNIAWPKDILFDSEQNPVTASVVIIPKPGSDIINDRSKIESIQKLLKFAVDSLEDEYIVIIDNNGVLLND